MTFRHFSRALAGVSLLALAGTAAAQTPGAPLGANIADANEIIVTATKRNSSLQDVPFSINAQTQVDIQRSGATTLEDISRNVAGLTIQNLGPGQSQVSIRGVSAGQIVRDQPGVKEQVGIYLDESVISLSLFTPDLDLFDLNRIETLRGPQGTLFGSGSVGGTIRYITNQPKLGKVEGLVEGDVNFIDGGSMGGSVKGAVNVPLGNKLAARAVGYYTRYGGYIDALRPGGVIDRNVNSGERYGGRLALRFEPTESISITPRVIYQHVETSGFNREETYNLFANPFTTTRPRITFDERQQYLLLREKFRDNTFIADATINVDFGGVAATSVSTYTDRNILVSRDASALTGSVSVDLGFPAAAVTLPSNLLDTTKVKSFTQEVRLASTGTGPFQWVIGGFYANTDRKYDQRLPTPGYDAFTDATLRRNRRVGLDHLGQHRSARADAARYGRFRDAEDGGEEGLIGGAQRIGQRCRDVGADVERRAVHHFPGDHVDLDLARGVFDFHRALARRGAARGNQLGRAARGEHQFGGGFIQEARMRGMAEAGDSARFAAQ